MNWIGYLFAVVSMVSLGMLGILSKLAERRGCSPLATTTVVFASATAMMGIYVGLFKGAGFLPPARIVGIAFVFGVITALSSWVFLYGIRFGKITTSWVVISLSAAVPTVASTLIYHERMGLRKTAVLLLAAVAILLLWMDMREDAPARARATGSSAAPAARQEREG